MFGVLLTVFIVLPTKTSFINRLIHCSPFVRQFIVRFHRRPTPLIWKPSFVMLCCNTCHPHGEALPALRHYGNRIKRVLRVAPAFVS